MEFTLKTERLLIQPFSDSFLEAYYTESVSYTHLAVPWELRWFFCVGGNLSVRR